jgi:hypothetical protein
VEHRVLRVPQVTLGLKGLVELQVPKVLKELQDILVLKGL